MANKITTSTTAELPTLRKIFSNSDLTEYTTAKFDKADKKFTALLKAVCKTFEEFDGIDTAATEKLLRLRRWALNRALLMR